MFEGLDDIDWRSLIWWGESFPEKLRNVAAGGDHRALESLYHSLKLMGAGPLTYPAVLIALPFLIDLLSVPDLPTLPYVLLILHDLTLQSLVKPSSLQRSLERLGHKDKDVSPMLLLRMEKNSLDLYQSILRYVEQYRSFLKHSDARVQRIALALLSNLCYDYPWFYHDALMVAMNATDPYLKAEAIYYLGCFTRVQFASDQEVATNDEAERLVYERSLPSWLSEYEPRPVQMAAAVILGQMARPPFSERLLPVLIEAFMTPIPYEDIIYRRKNYSRIEINQIEDIPSKCFYGNSYGTLQLLAEAGHPEGLIALFQASDISFLASYDAFHTIRVKQDIGLELLHLVFRKRGEEFRHNHWRPAYYYQGRYLNEHQQRMLRLIVDNDDFWKAPTDALSSDYGLPNSRIRLRFLLWRSQRRWLWRQS